MTLTERIEINPAVMMGKPVVVGTRIPVELITRKLSQGESEADLLEAYPRLTREDIRTARALGDLCRAFRVRELALFGSVLREDFRPDSDLDFLVEFEPGTAVGLLMLARLRRELESLFNRPVDLVPRSSLKAGLRKEIVDHARTLYAA
ncbi:MAG TPA: DUF433 domain-containing protein [Thermoanaerobaculia bacterium]|jgi:hypothetical protein